MPKEEANGLRSPERALLQVKFLLLYRRFYNADPLKIETLRITNKNNAIS